MTGAYLRVKRDGKWENIEIEFLTDAEREENLKDDPRLINWLNLVCNKLSEIEELLQDLEKDGVIKSETDIL